MTFEETIRESIRKFYAGKGFKAYTEAEEFKYTKDYFDRIEEEMLGASEVETPKGMKNGNKRKSS